MNLKKIIILMLTIAMSIYGSYAYMGKRVHLHEFFMPISRNWYVKIHRQETTSDSWEGLCMEGWEEHPSMCPEGWSPHTEYPTHELSILEGSYYWIRCVRETICVTNY